MRLQTAEPAQQGGLAPRLAWPSLTLSAQQGKPGLFSAHFMSVQCCSLRCCSLRCSAFLRYVCPTGSASPHAPSNACPPGTVGNHLDLFDKSQCEPCPAGFICARGTWFSTEVSSLNPQSYHSNGKWDKIFPLVPSVPAG